MHLFFIYNVETGLVWMTKIITDPFNDFMLYRQAPLALLRGELIDPGLDILEHQATGRSARLSVGRISSNFRDGRAVPAI